MTYIVKDFPVFHRYLASILLEVKHAEGSLSHIMEKVGEYTVTGRCTCGEETCNTMYMDSESLVGKDGTYCFGFNIGFIIFSFYKDGFFQLESLADRSENNYPFYQEIRDVLGGKKVEYDVGFVEEVVESFMSELQQQKIVSIEVE